MADTREILLKLIGRETVSTAAKKAADGIDDLGDSADDAAKSTKGLDKALEESRRRMVDLQRQAAKTGDLDLRKAAAKAGRDVKQWESLKKSLADAGGDGALGFAARFNQRIGPLIAAAPVSPHMAAVLGGAAAAAAPLVSAAIGGAISAGAVAGAVGIGVALASQDAKVQAAGTRLSEKLFAAIKADASPMVDPVLDGLDLIEERADRLRPAFRRIFEDAARYAPTLFGAAADSSVALIESFEKVVDNADPVVDMLGVQIPNTARTLGAALETMTADAGIAAEALSVGFTLLNATVTVTAGTVKILTELLPIFSGALLYANQQITGTGEAVGETAPRIDVYGRSLAETSKHSAAVAAQTRSLDQILQDFADTVNTAFSAETRFGEALDEAKAKIYDNAAGVNINTEAGRRNREMLSRLATSTRDAAAATAAQAGGQSRANGIMTAGYNAFVRAARGMGLSKEAARELAAALGLVKSKSVTVTTTFVSRYVSDKGVHVSGPGGSGTIPKAGGGPVGPGQTYLVGEEGPELVRFSGRGEVIPADQTRAMLSGGAGGSGVAGAGININLSAGVIGSRAELERWLVGAIDNIRRKGRITGL